APTPSLPQRAASNSEQPRPTEACGLPIGHGQLQS
ncbi:hypothetical protein AK812_SmicGene47010, partial [Symbiodinium microadriaticum]